MDNKKCAFVKILPQDYYAPIAEPGVQLSSRQHSYIGIAQRNSQKSPPMLIIDEAARQLGFCDGYLD